MANGDDRRRERYKEARRRGMSPEEAMAWANESSVQGVARKAFEGLTFGFGPEIEAGVRAALDPYATYEDYSTVIGEEMERFQQMRPKTSFVSDIGGSVLLPGVGAGKLAARAGSRWLPLLAEGAVVGGLEGAGRTEGGVGERAVGSAIGTGLGLAGGAVMGGLGYGVSRLMGGRRSRETLGELGEALEADTGMPLEQLEETLPERLTPPQGEVETLADIGGESTRRIAEREFARDFPQAEQVSSQLDLRRAERQPRLRQGLAQGMDMEGADLYATAEALTAAKKATADRLYQEARDVGQVELVALQDAAKTKYFRKALQAAEELAEEAGQSIGPLLDDGGNLIRNPTVAELHDMKMYLDDVIRVGADSERGFTRTMARTVRQNLEPVLDELSETVPAYQTAREYFAGASQMEDAFRAGRQALRGRGANDPNRVRATLRGLKTKGEREAFQYAAAYEFLQDLPSLTSSATSRGWEVRRPVLAEIFGEEVVSRMDDVINRERRMIQTEGIKRGSRTAPLAARMVGDPATFTGGVIGGGGIFTGDPKLMAAGAAMSFGEYMRRRAQEQATGTAMDVLTATGDDLYTALERIMLAGAERAPRASPTASRAMRAAAPLFDEDRMVEMELRY